MEQVGVIFLFLKFADGFHPSLQAHFGCQFVSNLIGDGVRNASTSALVVDGLLDVAPFENGRFRRANSDAQCAMPCPAGGPWDGVEGGVRRKSSFVFNSPPNTNIEDIMSR